MQFSHLHNHTQFSLLDGASNIGKLYKKAQNDKMPAVAITDHGNMYGVFQFVSEAWKNTKVVGTDDQGNEIKEPIVKPIVGCEFYLVADRHKNKFTREEGRDKRYHQLFLAKNEKGYQNLTKLCSLGFMEGMYGKYPRIDKELVLKYHEGLIATTCCIGAEVPQAILYKSEAEAETLFKWWLDLFGEDYYVELQRHDMAEQVKVNEVLMRFAKKYNVPVIASNDSHYVEQEDYNAHDILLCINTGEKQATPTNKEFSDDGESRKGTRFAFWNDQFYFKNTQEMSTLFSDIPEALDNTQMIVDKIKPLQLKRDILLPHFKVPDEFNNDQDAFLMHLTWKGAHERYQEITPDIEERINFELFTIRTMGFAGYFLIVSDFIKAGRDLGVFIGPGRGSAAGSAVAYCIGITNIDPIKYNLLFERFLNPDRKSMPDIDTDFDDEGRQKVIDYVVDKYGRNQVAHIVTYGTMAAKMSIKDVARVLDYPLQDSNALAKLVPDKPGTKLSRVLHAPITTKEAKNGEKSLDEKEGYGPEDIENILKIREFYKGTDEASRVLHEAEKLEGSVRNTGIHAAGIIIAPKDLSDLIPVCTAKDVKLLITQYEGKIIEDAGVIKMDFLGLKTLSIIKDALALIKMNYNLDIDIDTIPLDDEETYKLYQRGDTNATFQFESPGMQKHLINLKPDKFADLIAMNALYRPGPLQYIPNFIKRKHGEEAISYDLPEMEEFLAETYGISVYQEQVMLLSQKLGGFSKGDADVLRKAMGKKDRYTLDKMKGKFIDGAIAKGLAADKLDKVWTDWEAFAQYAFNKSHSTCYAFVAFQTAYLKAHYPSEYMAAVMNNANSIEKITFFMEECQRMGLNVLGPDVNESLNGFSVNKEGVIRFGLGALKGVGEAAVVDIIEERTKGGPFESIFNLITRVNQRTVNKKSLESLAYGGGFDSFSNMHRAQYFHTLMDGETFLSKIIRFGQQVQAEASMSVSSLFGDMEMPVAKHPDIPKVEPWTLSERLAFEKEVIGIYLSGHPLDNYKFEMSHYNITSLADIEDLVDKQVRVIGFMSDPRHLLTKKGDKYGRFILNDYSGFKEVNLWREDYVKFGNYLSEDQKVMMIGRYQEQRFRPGTFEFKISEMMLMSDVRKRFTKALRIRCSIEKVNADFIKYLYDNYAHNDGDCELEIFVVSDETEIKLKSNGTKSVLLNDSLIHHLEEMKEQSVLDYKVVST
ncbi:DNA polymerase III subunit alpha [Taibaiella sp. KBW10]|uniref:DNA polymerase III subunit alpha n=1 Tax=Taibaiella sp. KBW10 TaxID=2153357 RepID=UPI000F5AB576|nr:DNA polymerase III subunit alpha [Taibaiella sp. KBW10]RQO30444.1 DNA polymerase III subunit alpha [Taibaiella sp. KBW10]